MPILNMVKIFRKKTFDVRGRVVGSRVVRNKCKGGPKKRMNIDFLQNDPELQVIVNDFTQEMFTVQVIEVLGTPLGTDVYVRNFVTQN
jgi:hypothetical protein